MKQNKIYLIVNVKTPPWANHWVLMDIIVEYNTNNVNGDKI